MPFYVGQSVTYGHTWLNTVLAAMKTDPGAALIVTPKIRLSKQAAFNPTSATTLEELEANEADYTGYTTGGYTVTVPDPVNLGATAGGLVISQLFVATVDSPFVPNAIYGWWIDNGTDMIAAEGFAEGIAIPISAPGDFLELDAVLAFTLEATVPPS